MAGPEHTPVSVTEGLRGMKAVAACVLFCLLSALLWWFVPLPVLGPVLGAVVLAVLFALRFPFVVMLAFVAFSFFRIHEVIPQLNPLRLPQLLAVGALAVLLWHTLISKTIRPFWCREFTWLALFFILVTIGALLASNRGEALAAWNGTYVKIVTMTFAIAWLMEKPAHFAMATRVFILSGLLVGSVALYNKSAGIGLVEETRVTIGRELGSVLGDPNDLALVLLFPAGFSLASALESRASKWDRLLGFAGFIVNLLAIVATQSRGGLLGICAVMGIFAYRRIKSKMLLFSLAAMVLLVLFAVAGISDRSSGGAAEEGIDASAMGRLYAWEAAWGMALAHPFRGVGLNNFYYNYYFYSPHWDGLNHAVHSTWFNVLSETGFLGFAVFMLMLLTTLFHVWRVALKLDRSEPYPVAIAINGVAASMVGFCVSGTFLTQGFTWPVYLQLALAVAGIRAVEKHVAEKRAEEKTREEKAITNVSEKPSFTAQSSSYQANSHSSTSPPSTGEQSHGH